MLKIKTLNKITRLGLDLFDRSKYAVSDGEAAPDAVIVRSGDMHALEVPASLLAVARAGAGYNNIPVEKYAGEGIVVFNTPGANANAVKELAVAALLLASRDIIGGIEWAKTLTSDVAKEVEAGKSKFVGHEIIGKTLGVIGTGNVGSRTANAGVALGMEVIGQDPYMTIESALSISNSVKMVKERAEIFEKSDYIVLHSAFTPETKHMINAEAIAKMRDGVRVINLSRADLVDDDAMTAALESGKVAKYVTDFPNEKVLKMRNAIAIPHLGASTEESEDNCAIMAVRQIIDYLENGNIKNSVNYPDLSVPRTTSLRVCLAHKNIPNIISQISTVFGSQGINIENMANRSKGELAYTICEIEGSLPLGVAESLKGIPGIIRIRVV